MLLRQKWTDELEKMEILLVIAGHVFSALFHCSGSVAITDVMQSFLTEVACWIMAAEKIKATCEKDNHMTVSFKSFNRVKICFFIFRPEERNCHCIVKIVIGNVQIPMI